MSLHKFREQTHNFATRIAEAFYLEEDEFNIIPHRKTVLNWIQQESVKLKEEKEKYKNEGFIGGLLNYAGLNSSRIKMDSNESQLQIIKTIMKMENVEFDQNYVQELDIPQAVLESLNHLQKKTIPNYYGVVSSPIMKNMFLRKKEDFDNCLKKVVVNDIKLCSLGSETESVVKYQRNLIEQLFNRLFNVDNELSTVIKIQIQNKNFEKSIEVYCYIEDLRFKNSCKFCGLDKAVYVGANRDLEVKIGEEKLIVNELSIFDAFLTQMLIVPIQTIVSDYMVVKADNGARLVKFHKELSPEQFGTYLKQHPTLRNPLFFFYSFIKTHEYQNEAFKKHFDIKEIYSNFYEILNILIELMSNDFNSKLGMSRTNSLCFDGSVFGIIWKIFHELAIFQDWLEEIINPIKESVTLYEINNKLHPIFNEIIKLERLNYEQFKQSILTLPIENYLTLNVSKLNIEKYKMTYVNINAVQYHPLNGKLSIFQNIFYPTILNYDLNNVHIFESLYFLNFVSKNSLDLLMSGKIIPHSSWKLKKIWKEIVQIRNQQSQKLQYLSINLDIMAFYFDFDSIEYSTQPFDWIKNDTENFELIASIDCFIFILKTKFQKKMQKYLSKLIEKSFKYKKYEVVKHLIERGIQINNYEEIFAHELNGKTSISKLSRNDEKNKLVELMKNRDPEMFRRYQWEELINVWLKEECADENVAILTTIGKGKFYVEKDIYTHLTSRNIMNNTISRKDYMFSSNRLIAKVKIHKAEAYIQVNEFPLLRYFYSFFFEKLGKGSQLLNFCGFFAEKGNLVHLIECIPQCFNFEKGLSSQSETELKNFVNEDDISQAIIISMILMPTNVLLKNIIISPLKYQGNGKEDRKSFFIVDLHDFYQKNGFERNGGNTILKVRNSLFIFEEMRNIISDTLMKKYAHINVLEIINSVFKKCSGFISEVNKLRPKKVEHGDGEQQLYSLIFQNGFLDNLVERMFKIRNACEKNLRNKTHISHLQLLEIINPSLSYYYQQIIQSSHKLVERQRLMLDQGFKKSFIISQSLISFLPPASQLQDVRDSFPNHYMRFNFQGPTENLSHLYHNIRKFDIYQQKITEIDKYNHEVIEYFIRNIDLSIYQKEERESLMHQIQQYSKEYLNREKNCLPLSVIRISHNDTLKEKNLKFSDERLKQMIFEEVKCSGSQSNALLRKYQNMSCLQLRHVRGVQKIGQLMLNIPGTLQIKNLKYLAIISCPDMEIIDIRCDQLQQLTLRSNSSLTNIYIKSNRLRKMDCSLCPKLRLENIGIYILRMIDVLLCDNSCDGDVRKLWDKSYAIFLTRILRQLLNRFHESNQYKLELVVTLVKLELLDEKYFRFGNSKISNNLLALIAKAGLDILDIVEEHIFDLFLVNKQVELLCIDELLKIELPVLRVIAAYIFSHSGRKDYASLRFTEFIKIPLIQRDQLPIISQIFEHIGVQKTFTLHLRLSKELLPQFYISLVQLINQKINLEKFEIIFTNSELTGQFIQQLFQLQSRNKIFKLEFVDCMLLTAEPVAIEVQPHVKHLHFSNCFISSLRFLVAFNNLASFEVKSCKFGSPLSNLYELIGGMSSLIKLSLVKLRGQQQIELDSLFDNLSSLHKLEEFDFSSNELSLADLKLFSSKISHLRVYQLVLYDFYKQVPEINQPIDRFMFTQWIKILNIEFKSDDQHLLDSFIKQVGINSSLMRLNIKTDRELPSTLFEPLKQNKKLEAASSNWPLPNWLNNHILTNTKNNSCILNFEPFEPMVSARQEEDFYRIGLSLDGGGVRGLLLATELDYLATNVKQPLHKIFDVVGGTSIGGILALASTGTLDGVNPVCSTKDLIEIFEVYGTRIFKKSQMKQFTNLVETKYDVRSFQDLLYNYFKDTRLSEVLSETNVLVTSVNRLKNQDFIFRSLNSIFDRNQDFYMRDVARATSAAPTFFSSAQIKNIDATQKFSLVDGGVGLNNPSKLVIDDVIKITQNEAHKKNYFLLSLGTGKLKNEAIPENAGIKDLAPIIDSFTISANYFIEKDLAQNYKGHYLRVSPEINLSTKDGELDNTSPEILKVYKQTGLNAAKEYFSDQIAFGKFKNQNLIEWLQENTARKYDV